MTPDAYELKRVIVRHWPRFWLGDLLFGAATAPIYHFADQERYDSDEVEPVAQWISAGPLRLPHPRVIFEVADRSDVYRSQIAFVQETEGRVEAALLARGRGGRKLWTDTLCWAHFRPDGAAEIAGNPRIAPITSDHVYAQSLTGLVWRALAILSNAGVVREQTVSKLKRPKLARAGVTGWSWHQVDIDPERLRPPSPPRGGTHASPRWHIRRGHWRQLRDGRRVFVRECQVGDRTRGGVVKDYCVQGSEAA